MISHKHKFVFIHYPKTGGETVAAALNPTAGNKHENAMQARATIGRENWNKYFKFSIVRNPWAQVISMYFHLRNPANRKKYGAVRPTNACKVACNSSFLDYCRLVIRDEQVQAEEVRVVPGPVKHFAPFCEWISDEDKNFIIDYIGKFENFQEDFNTICDKIGIPRQELPHKNKSKHKHYTEYYDDETKQIVAERYAKDIKLFGYKFGE